MYRFSSFVLLILVAVATTANGQGVAPTSEIGRFQGSWRVVELIDDGQAVLPENIPAKLPSGGRVQIVSNTFQFTSPTAGQCAKVFGVNATVLPKTIDVSAWGNLDAHGIYRFEGERLFICASEPLVAARPTEFSSRPGSKHMLMPLERTKEAMAAAPPTGTTVTAPPANPAPANPPSNPQPASAPAPEVVKVQVELPDPPPAVAVPVTVPTTVVPVSVPVATTATARDAEVRTMLLGSWRLTDGAGTLQVSFDSTGGYRTYREVQDPTSYYRAFVQTPVSAGTWSVVNSAVIFRVTSSTDPTRVNQLVRFVVQPVSAKEFTFIDPVGRVGRAVRL